ncbi:MAG: hypothetical protein ACLRH0_05270 [Blautia wexlerae]
MTIFRKALERIPEKKGKSAVSKKAKRYCMKKERVLFWKLLKHIRRRYKKMEQRRSIYYMVPLSSMADGVIISKSISQSRYQKSHQKNQNSLLIIQTLKGSGNNEIL